VQLRQILIDNGIWCTLQTQQRTHSAPSRNAINWTRSYILNFKASFLHLLFACKVQVPTQKHTRHVMEDADYFYTPIRSIGEHEYDGPVHNLTVETDHSYVAGGVGVSNCHDDEVFAAALGVVGIEAAPAARLLAGIERQIPKAPTRSGVVKRYGRRSQQDTGGRMIKFPN